MYVIVRGPAKGVDKLPNVFVDVTVAAYATFFDGILTKDAMTTDVHERAHPSTGACEARHTLR